MKTSGQEPGKGSEKERSQEETRRDQDHNIAEAVEDRVSKGILRVLFSFKENHCMRIMEVNRIQRSPRLVPPKRLNRSCTRPHR